MIWERRWYKSGAPADGRSDVEVEPPHKREAVSASASTATTRSDAANAPQASTTPSPQCSPLLRDYRPRERSPTPAFTSSRRTALDPTPS